MGKNYFFEKWLLIFLFTLCGKNSIAQSSNSHSLKRDSIVFTEKKFWAGAITLTPHGLNYGNGLANDGSFFVGDSFYLKKFDFKTGKVQTLVKGSGDESARASVVSPDNKQIAFSWFNGNFTDLMIVSTNTKSGSPSLPRILLKGAPGNYINPYDWSPDGKWILGLTNKEIGLVSVKNRTIKLIKDMGNYGCNKSSFSPDGQYIVFDYSTSSGKSDIHICRIDGTNEEILIKDNGYAPYWSPDDKYIFFLSKQDSVSSLWNLCVQQISKTKAIGSPAIIKKGIDFFAPLGFTSDGSFLYGEKSPTKLNVYQAELNFETPKNKQVFGLISTHFSDWNVEAIWSPDGKYLAYKSRRENGKEIIVIRSIETGLDEDIISVQGSIVQWFPDNTSLLIRGLWDNGSIPLYKLNVKTKEIALFYHLEPDRNKKSFLNRPVLSVDGKLIFYTEVDPSISIRICNIFSRDLQSGEVKQLASFDSSDITSFSTSPDGKYLSMIVLNLYQRQALERVSALRVISLQSGKMHELFNEPWGDATKFFGLGWSPDSRYIYYVRVNLQTASSNLWRIPVSGGPPQNTGIAMTDLRMPNIHPDGKRLVFSGGEGWFKKTYEIKAIKITSSYSAQSISNKKNQ